MYIMGSHERDETPEPEATDIQFIVHFGQLQRNLYHAFRTVILQIVSITVESHINGS